VIVIEVISFVFSVACIIASSIYLYLAYSGDSTVIYLQKSPPGCLSSMEGIFLGLAAIALLVCIYQGADTMLSWLPNNWGSNDEDGEFVTIRHSLAVLFTFVGGFSFLSYLTKAGPALISIKHANEEIKFNEDILEAVIDTKSFSVDSFWRLKSIKNDIEKKLIELDVNAEDANVGALYTARNFHPECQRYRNLMKIIATIDSLEIKYKRS
jgi:hypothetical protein